MKDISSDCEKIIDEISKVIVGKRDVLERIMFSILANGHILFEDYPGLAKTMMAHCFSQVLGCNFRRVQFTPDLLPADITGTYVFNQKEMTFNLRKGPVFTNILLTDEINRAPPKTQAALLEAMQEKQVTLEGDTYLLDEPFIVMATQNPIEYEGTYPLPEAQLDRFLVKLRVGYPTRKQEKEILDRRKERRTDEFSLKKVVNTKKIVEMQKACEDVYVHEDIEKYMVDIVYSTRELASIEVGASPRGSLALFKLARARAAYYGRDFVIPDDVKEMVLPALSHRIILKPEIWYTKVTEITILDSIVEKIPVPKVEELEERIEVHSESGSKGEP
ncbi:MAG: MoxR family ATPase [Theionarchaea archaeon]|nr:MAG: magnesium chelatase [Theionarchaea archaeon DG-70-1]MBU7025841.1 MoxR family ATPase [Theionarchaea archaeon]